MDQADFEELVDRFYEALYRFALTLTRSEAAAYDLTQQTFYIWARKGHQLRDKNKVKSWLFTTLNREFLAGRRRDSRFPHYDIDAVNDELPSISPEAIRKLDADTVMAALLTVDDLYRAPLLLFYTEDHSYAEIADILNIPIGTVMSRLSRGKDHLRQLLAERLSPKSAQVLPFQSSQPATKEIHE